jgi:hypothetical protein
METTRKDVEMSALTVGQGDKPRVCVEDGVYEAELTTFRVSKEDSPWGEKQYARLIFKIVKGKYENVPVTFKLAFFQDRDTGNYVIGSKSGLGEAIRVLTNGKGTLTKDLYGTRVFASVKTALSKKTGEKYCMVEKIMQMPSDYVQNTAATAAPQATVQAAPPAAPAPAGVNGPAAPAPAPAAQKSGLLDDLTDMGDYEL